MSFSQAESETEVCTEEKMKEANKKAEESEGKDESNIKKGSCYALINPINRKWWKIGRTSDDQEGLMKQYDKPRIVPIKYELKHWVDFDNEKLAEKNIFDKLKKYRSKYGHGNTEWFYFDELEENEIYLLIEKEFNKVKEFMEKSPN